ncbi:MAG: HAMP domain-containing sensor histidine kinase, partial [Clostridia bacterium]
KGITTNILEKYGIDEYNSDFYVNNTNFKIKVYTSVFISFFIIFVILIYVILKYIKSQDKKIKDINKYTDDVLNGIYNLDIRDNDEGKLSILKNKIYDMTVMLKEKNIFLDENKKQMEKLIADISHQLKTPLTSLNLINELLYSDIPNDKKNEFLKDMNKELSKIQWQIKTLLNIAKLDSKTLLLKKDKVNLYNMCKKCMENFSIMCEVMCVNINIDCSNDICVSCDELWTMEAINNLIKNAIEHSSKNIIISGEKTNLYTKISICDDGEGIDKNDISHIFDRFYKSKNSKNGSLGLGLAFTKSIVINQGGDIKVKSIQNKGTTFNIKLYD